MKTLKLFFILILISGTVSAQFKVLPNGQTQVNGPIEINGHTKINDSVKINGKTEINGRIDVDAPAGAVRIYRNATSQYLTAAENTALTLYNKNETANNCIGLDFSTTASKAFVGKVEQTCASIVTQFVDRDYSFFPPDFFPTGASNFHILTTSKGTLAERFSIYHNPNSSGSVNFLFKAGYGNIWMDNTGDDGYATIRPGIDATGTLGTNTRQWYKLYTKSHPITGSDERTKNNIQDIDTKTIQKISQVRGVKYKLNLPTPSIEPDKKIEGEELDADAQKLRQEENAKQELFLEKERKKEHFGFIAQELIEIFPEVVEYDKENDYYGIQYTALIPILFEGIKEQQVLIDVQNLKFLEQQTIIDAQSLKLKELEEKLAKLIKADEKVINIKSTPIDNTSTENSTLTNAFLYQNIPNPFSTNTEIKYFIPEGVRDAKLFIFSIQGNLLKTEKIITRGQGSLIINGTALTAGIYLYSLVLEGKEVDTKRMILTE